MKGRYRFHNGELLPINEWYRRQEPPKRSAFPTPYIRPDGMSPTFNPVDGREYDSKSAYEAAVAAKGAHIMEAGENSTAPRQMESPGGLERDIKEAIEKLESGNP